MKRAPVRGAFLLAAASLLFGGCVNRTWEDRYVVKEASPAVGTHHRRSYRYGEEVPPSVNPRVKVQGEGLKILLERMRGGGG